MKIPQFAARETFDGAIIERYNEIKGEYIEMPNEKYISLEIAKARVRELNKDCPPIQTELPC